MDVKFKLTRRSLKVWAGLGTSETGSPAANSVIIDAGATINVDTHAMWVLNLGDCGRSWVNLARSRACLIAHDH